MTVEEELLLDDTLTEEFDEKENPEPDTGNDVAAFETEVPENLPTEDSDDPKDEADPWEGLIEEETSPDAAQEDAAEPAALHPEEISVVDSLEFGWFDENTFAMQQDLSAEDLYAVALETEQTLKTGASAGTLFGSQLTGSAYEMYLQRVRHYAQEKNTGSMVLTYGLEDSPLVFDATAFLSYDEEKGKYVFDTGADGYQEAKTAFEYIMQSSVDAFLYDHPEVFWYRAGTYSFALSAKYNTETRLWEGYVRRMTNMPKTIFSGAADLEDAYRSGLSETIASVRLSSDFNGDGSVSEAELLQGIHDELCRRLYYDYDALASYSSTQDYRIFSSLGAFVSSAGRGVVCEGYAKAFKVLCDAFGLNCILVGGRLPNGTGHMWNNVQVNGTWYLVDVTWDDTMGEEISHKNFLTDAQTARRTPSGNFGGSSNGNTMIFSYPAVSGHSHSFARTTLLPASLPSGTKTGDTLVLTEQYTCAADGITYWEQKTSYQISITAPTCTAGGYATFVSTADQTAVTGFPTAAQGHTFQNGRCVRCGKGDTLAHASVSVPASYGYTGGVITPSVTVRFGTNVLKAGTDYTISCNNNIVPGNATVTITGRGNYSGSRTCAFSITRAPIRNAAAAAIADRAYTGKTQTPAPTLRYQGRTLKQGTDYTVLWKNNKAIGTATMVITGKGNFTGTKSLTFRIVPKNVAVSSLRSLTRKKAVLRWKKLTGITGYQIQYASTPTFAGARTKTVSASKTSVTLTGLTSRKYSYVRIRSYKTVKGVRYYGAWSTVKKVKVK